MSVIKLPDLDSFLQSYRRMSVAPLRGTDLVIKGTFDFTASSLERLAITDSYRLEIRVPLLFPKVLPTVIETARKIHRDGNHHVHNDGSLCLGSPLRLRWQLSQHPTLIGFAEECLIPYLYGVSHKLKYGVFPFGELEHGKPGAIGDYLNLFELRTEDQVEKTLVLLGIKKRIANKKPCPCSCGKRLGKCRFHYKLNSFRKVAARSWFKEHLITMGKNK